MYKDEKFKYYNWNERPIAVPVDGGPVQMYQGGKWGDPPGKPWPAERYLQPGGDAAHFENEADLNALIADCDARDRAG